MEYVTLPKDAPWALQRIIANGEVWGIRGLPKIQFSVLCEDTSCTCFDTCKAPPHRMSCGYTGCDNSISIYHFHLQSKYARALSQHPMNTLTAYCRVHEKEQRHFQLDFSEVTGDNQKFAVTVSPEQTLDTVIHHCLPPHIEHSLVLKDVAYYFTGSDRQVDMTVPLGAYTQTQLDVGISCGYHRKQQQQRYETFRVDMTAFMPWATTEDGDEAIHRDQFLLQCDIHTKSSLRQWLADHYGADILGCEELQCSLHLNDKNQSLVNPNEGISKMHLGVTKKMCTYGVVLRCAEHALPPALPPPPAPLPVHQRYMDVSAIPAEKMARYHQYFVRSGHAVLIAADGVRAMYPTLTCVGLEKVLDDTSGRGAHLLCAKILPNLFQLACKLKNTHWPVDIKVGDVVCDETTGKVYLMPTLLLGVGTDTQASVCAVLGLLDHLLRLSTGIWDRRSWKDLNPSLVQLSGALVAQRGRRGRNAQPQLVPDWRGILKRTWDSMEIPLEIAPERGNLQFPPPPPRKPLSLLLKRTVWRIARPADPIAEQDEEAWWRLHDQCYEGAPFIIRNAKEERKLVDALGVYLKEHDGGADSFWDPITDVCPPYRDEEWLEPIKFDNKDPIWKYIRETLSPAPSPPLAGEGQGKRPRTPKKKDATPPLPRKKKTTPPPPPIKRSCEEMKELSTLCVAKTEGMIEEITDELRRMSGRVVEKDHPKLAKKNKTIMAQMAQYK